MFTLYRYSYSKTRGLFGGISLEGSVIMERQDANAIAYKADVTARMLLSGTVDKPEWAQTLIQTLEDCTGAPVGRRWVQELQGHNTGNYIFSGSGSPGTETGPSTLKKKERPGYFRRASSSSIFDFSRSQEDVEDPYLRTNASTNSRKKSANTTPYFETQFESDFVPETELRKHKRLASTGSSRWPDEEDDWEEGSPFNSTPETQSTGQSGVSRDWSHRRSVSAYTPKTYTTDDYTSVIRNRVNSLSSDNDGSQDWIEDLDGRPPPGYDPHKPKIAPKKELVKPLTPADGVARAIALYDFNAVQVSMGVTTLESVC